MDRVLQAKMAEYFKFSKVSWNYTVTLELISVEHYANSPHCYRQTSYVPS